MFIPHLAEKALLWALLRGTKVPAKLQQSSVRSALSSAPLSGGSPFKGNLTL